MPLQPTHDLPILFQQLTARLNLENVLVINLYKRGDWWLFDTKTRCLPNRCPMCGQGTLFHRYGSKKQYFDDCPLDGLPVRIRLLRRRYKCLACRKPFFEPVPDLDDTRRATRRLVTHIAQASLRHPFVYLASMYGVHERSVRRIAHSFYRALDSVGCFPTPRWMGIDEVSVNHLPRTVLTNLRDRKLYDILPDMRPDTIREFLGGIPGAECIDIVCMDFSSLFRKRVRECLPDAQIVVDKYHIIQRAIEGIDQIRRRVKKRKKGTIRDDTRILRTRRCNLTPYERHVLQRWEKDVPELATAYRLKEQFCEIWEAADEATARVLYAQWKDQVAKDVPNGFRRLINTIRRWDQEVFRCVTWKATNGYTERMNGIIKEFYRRGRRLGFPALRAKALYLFGYARPIEKLKKPKWEGLAMHTESEHESKQEMRTRAYERPPVQTSTIKTLAGLYVMNHEYNEYLSNVPYATPSDDELAEAVEL